MKLFKKAREEGLPLKRTYLVMLAFSIGISALLLLMANRTIASFQALSGNYIALYTVDPKTGAYLEYSVSADYESLGFEKEGADFFHKGIEDGKKAVYPDDLDAYLREFSKENVLRCARENGLFTMRYRLVIGGAPVDVMLRAALVREDGREKLIVGVNKLQENAKG